jgi:hypothetical protein
VFECCTECSSSGISCLTYFLRPPGSLCSSWASLPSISRRS